MANIPRNWTGVSENTQMYWEMRWELHYWFSLMLTEEVLLWADRESPSCLDIQRSPTWTWIFTPVSNKFSWTCLEGSTNCWALFLWPSRGPWVTSMKMLLARVNTLLAAGHAALWIWYLVGFTCLSQVDGGPMSTTHTPGRYSKHTNSLRIFKVNALDLHHLKGVIEINLWTVDMVFLNLGQSFYNNWYKKEVYLHRKSWIILQKTDYESGSWECHSCVSGVII